MKISLRLLSTTQVLQVVDAISAAASRQLADPSTTSVILPYVTAVGNVKNNVESFGGIPFAEAPEGPLRLKPPKKVERELGVLDVTGPAGACPQMVFNTDSDDLTAILANIAASGVVQDAAGVSEDCLTMVVARPQGVQKGDKLPVLFWIYGGAYELGWSSMYDATNFLNTGIDIRKPFIMVTPNYRVGAFGFLGGKEIAADGASNLGLLDQRMALEWVADHIEEFGGDPDRVTIWGESAGAMSVLNQMVIYGGDNTYNERPLFRAAIMNSGTALPAAAIDSERAQRIFDQVADSAGCANVSDPLDCLRGLEYPDFLNAANSVPFVISYDGVALPYLPRPDGVILRESPEVLVAQGKYAPVPMIVGDQEDEGTLFSLVQTNITDTEKLVGYLTEILFTAADHEAMRALVDTYPEDASAGSPFGTGPFNEIYSGFKRLAALLGDVLFTLSRRSFLSATNELHPEVPSWSYLASYNRGTPILGTFHGSDLIQVFYGIFDNHAANSVQSYYLSFLYTLDPNNGTDEAYSNWPSWSESNQLLHILSDRNQLLTDDFRMESYNQIVKMGGSSFRL